MYVGLISGNVFQRDIKSRKDLSKKNCYALFLVKLRVDISQKVLGMMFGMKPKQQPRVSEIFQDVLVSLNNNFVPRHLGYGHITREDYTQLHRRQFPTDFAVFMLILW